MSLRKVVHPNYANYPVAQPNNWMQNMGRYIALFALIFGFLAIISALMAADQEEYIEKAKKDGGGKKQMNKFLKEIQSPYVLEGTGRGAAHSSTLNRIEVLVNENKEDKEDKEVSGDLVNTKDSSKATGTQDNKDNNALADTLYSMTRQPDTRASRHWKNVHSSHSANDQRLMTLGVGVFQEMFPRTSAMASVFLPELETFCAN
jgi:hypothetical protein